MGLFLCSENAKGNSTFDICPFIIAWFQRDFPKTYFAKSREGKVE